MNREALGTRIRAARENAGFTQEQLAASIGRRQNTISRLEAGQVRIYLEDLFRISEVLDVSILVLLLGETEGELSDIDMRLQLEKLSSTEAKHAALQLLRVFSNYVETNK